MRIIKEITDHINEEIEGVCSYLHFAHEVKGENEYIFDTLMNIIPQEIKHIEIWHDVAIKEINKMKELLKSQNKEVPPYMLEIWQDEHEEYVETMAKIKYKLDILKGI